MSSSNCYFLTCIQIFQKTGQVIWYSHLFQNFPKFVVIHTVKGFGIVNEAEVDVFLEFSCFFYDPVNVGNLIFGSSVFSKSNLKFLVHILLKPSMRPGFNPWIGKIPWRRKWQPTPTFLPRKSHGQRSLMGYSA